MINPVQSVEVYEISLKTMCNIIGIMKMKIHCESCPAMKIEPNEIIFSPSNYKSRRVISIIYDRNKDGFSREKVTITHETFSKEYALHAFKINID